jgi:tetrahydrodipicolinate N-succinyltransferase
MWYTVFAVGYGHFKEGSDIPYFFKSFRMIKKNVLQVNDVLGIISEELEWDGSNAVIALTEAMLPKLRAKFDSHGHKGSVEFIDSITSEIGAFICLKKTNEAPKNLVEAYLILDLFSKGICNASNEHERFPLTKVFEGLETIELSGNGLPIKNDRPLGACDKFPSWLLFNEPGSNRLTPGAFIRQGARIGESNTFMSCATINFGVWIGNGNLFDTHCSIATCAQIGNDNEFGSFVSIEGVLSPINEKPVVIGNDNFFGIRCRIGTGLDIGNNNFWASGVSISVGTPLRDLREGSKNYGQYIEAKNVLQKANDLMIIGNNAVRYYNGIKVYSGEYLLFVNTKDNQLRFKLNEDLTINN